MKVIWVQWVVMVRPHDHLDRLAERSFGDQKSAYDHILTAYHAYPHDHTTHALAQQELILSEDKTIPKQNALSYLSNAIERLTALDKLLKSDDT
jgi:hypothetical protein